MSVVLDRPLTGSRSPQIDQPVILRERIRVQPPSRPIEAPVERPVEAPATVKRKSGSRAAEILIAKAVMFCGLFAATYVCSSLGGHYLVEKSRNQAIEATSRANIAVQNEREVQRRLDVISSSSSIEQWALSHDFHPADGLGQTSKVDNLVATNQ